MITIQIDEKQLADKVSHYEIRKRKDAIVVVAVPKAHTLKEYKVNN